MPPWDPSLPGFFIGRRRLCSGSGLLKFSPVSCRGTLADRVIEESPCMKSSRPRIQRCLFLYRVMNGVSQTAYFVRRLFRRCRARPLARPGRWHPSRSAAENISVWPGLCAGNLPPVLQRRKTATICQIQQRRPAFRVERQAIDDARAGGQSDKPVEDRATALRFRRLADRSASPVEIVDQFVELRCGRQAMNSSWRFRAFFLTLPARALA